ncbi:MAG: aminotransferase class V-fold PLP-dependent enzyme [Spirochaetaceae bacterium]|nr:aminotransferase class V-fold PLP-dependent enzyme [Spirochaetaceae bacterium]
MHYFDYAATAKPDEAIFKEAGRLALSHFANPSSSHQLGRQAKILIEELRNRAAMALGVAGHTITFNSGATEGNGAVMLSFINNLSKGEILLNAGEHAAVYENFKLLKNFGYTVKELVAAGGLITPELLQKKLTKQTKLVAIMLLNNETGLINNITQLAATIRDYEAAEGCRIHLHVDATQALGKINFDITKLDTDSLVLAAHKAGGPRGSGLLYQKKWREPFLGGGGQELGNRSGTENLLAIAGMVLTLEKYYNVKESRHNENLLINGLQDLGATVLPNLRLIKPENFCPYIVSCAFSPLPGEVVVRMASEHGLYISTGSACSSNKKTDLRALTTAGVSEQLAKQAVRFSYSPATGKEEVKVMLAVLKEVLEKLRIK